LTFGIQEHTLLMDFFACGYHWKKYPRAVGRLLSRRHHLGGRFR
jgi:hypothetical protein